MVIALVTGGFDPLHSGHINLFQQASKIGTVVVGLNSDNWLKNKKGINFLTFDERKYIIQELKSVYQVIEFDDSDGSAVQAIKKTLELFPGNKIIFCNGGDRTHNNIPEYDFCLQNNVEMVFNVGGGKTNSSSWLLSNWTSNNKETRLWGEFQTVLTDGNIVKIKKLIIEPGKAISYQRHKNRVEYWVVTEGKASVVVNEKKQELLVGQSIKIEQLQWHTLKNETDYPLKIIEIQHGTSCSEQDIERC